MPTFENREVLKKKLQDAVDYIQAAQQSPEAVISRLEGRDSPEAIRWRLRALVDCDRISDAADLVRNREAEPQWGDLAAFALAANGESDAARRVIDRVNKQADSLGIRRRCLLSFAEGMLWNTLRGTAEQPCIPDTLTADQISSLQKVVDILEPVIAAVTANDVIENELESRAVEVALETHGLIGNRTQAMRLGQLLATRKPVPMVLAHAVLQRWIDAPANLPQRLREERPESFDASLLAAVIEGEYLANPEPAFQSGLQLVRRASSGKQREQLFGVLLNLAQSIGDDAMQQLEGIAHSLLKENPRSLSLFTATQMINRGSTDEAAPLLEELRDESDPQWLQAYAGYLNVKNDKVGAADYLAKASQLLSHPDLLWKTAIAAYDVGHIDDSVRALEQLLSLTPEDIVSRNNIVLLYMRRNDYHNAARHLKVLAELKPESEEYSLNYASCLALSGQTEEALSIYDALCASSAPPMDAYLGRAKLLKSIDRARDAFDSLNGIRAEHWGNAHFLAVFLDLAFVTGEEDAGGEAFNRLRELQAQGKIENDVLISMSLDDMVDRNDEYQRKRDLVNEALVKGKMPWTMGETVLGRVSYWGWFTRTQSLTWLFDDPLNRAQYSIYSTNAFAAIQRRKSHFEIEQIECSSKGTSVVIDLSALITLHRLGLLDKATNYFDRVLFPSVFLSNALEEGSRLVLHQGSLKTFYQSVDKALDTNKITVIQDYGTPGCRPMPYVNEHTIEEDETEHYYRLRDVLSVLHKEGRITPARYRKSLSSAHKPAGTDRRNPPLKPASMLLFSLSTLQTLSSCNLLTEVIQTFKVHITAQDKTEVRDTLNAIDSQEQVLQWHEALWNMVRRNERFVQAALIKSAGNEDHSNKGACLAACGLAIQEKLPLLADDRACQMVVHNDRNGCRRAFGSDHLIIALEQSGQITRGEATDALIMLMGWRYRFILPPAWLLKTLADRFEDNPPGRQLRDVARYLQDCMRDVGLFAGIENTTPPTSMGLQLFHEWIQRIAVFVVDVWADDRFSDNAAEELTRWAMTELLPSMPRMLPQLQQARAGTGGCSRIMMANSLLHSHKIKDAQRGNHALRIIANTLGMDDSEYLRVATEVINHA